MKTRLADPPRETARGMNQWWKRKRLNAREPFAEELRDARHRIAEKPDLGRVYAVRQGGIIVRRILMPGTRTHVFYEVWETEQVIMIVALWGATRETGPDLGTGRAV